VNAHGGNWLTALLPFVIIAVVVGLRLRSMSRERPLNIGTLWIVPAIYLVLVGSMIVTLPPSAGGWSLIVAGVAVGAVVGWHRGKLIRIERNSNGKLMQKASPLAMLLLLALIVLKLGARAIFGDTAAGHPGSAAMLLTDAFLGFALGLLSATRLELYLRARRILEAS
jgi:hypothetical protein